MMEIDENKMEKIGKHFTEAPNLTIQPNKIESAKQPEAKVKVKMDMHWTTDGNQYYGPYEVGKLLTTAKEFKQSTEILSLLGELIVKGTKAGASRGGISTEKMRNHFDVLQSILKAIESDLNAQFARINAENEENAKEFDNMDLLALMNGLVAIKVYG